MRTIFIPSKIREELDESKILEILSKLPRNIAIAYSIQYKDQAVKIREILRKKNTITKFIQVLGCSNPKFPISTKAILLISDGEFHAKSLAFASKIPVFLFNHNKLTKISESDIKEIEKRKKAAYVKFLSSSKIGVLISTKPGQFRKTAFNLKKNYKNKEFYFFIANNLNPSEFENFPEIQSWVNTACPRMDLENSRIVNIGDLKWK